MRLYVVTYSLPGLYQRLVTQYYGWYTMVGSKSSCFGRFDNCYLWLGDELDTGDKMEELEIGVWDEEPVCRNVV